MADRQFYDLAQQAAETAGLPPEYADYIWAQWYHESQGFTSQLARENNNFGGVTQVENNGEENRQPDGNNFYKMFNDPSEYAAWYGNYLKNYAEDGLYDSTDMESFVHALKHGGYFGADEGSYLQDMKNILAGEGVTPQVVNGDPFKSAAFQKTLDQASNFAYTPQADPVVVHQDTSPASFWERLTTGFMDTATTSGTADVLQQMWSTVAHTSHASHPQMMTSDDIEYVKKQLPNDPAAQEWALLHASDREELDFLINQKKVDIDRQAKIADWNDGHLVTAANLGRLVGGIADPLMLIPAGEALAGARLASRLGTAIFDVGKAGRMVSLAGRAVVGGANFAGYEVANTYLKNNFSPDKEDYSTNALRGFATGAVMGAIGGAFRTLGRDGKPVNPELLQAGLAAEHLETQNIKSALGMDLIKQETKGAADKLHDTSFGATIQSELYNKYEAAGRVKALSLNDAKQLVQKASGIALPNDAKAFYVPNEDYSILIKDNIKPGEVEGVMAHEMGAHGDLRRIMGDERYTQLLDKITKEADKPNSQMNIARKMSNSYDPEEILGYALENDMLNGNMMSVLKNRIRRGFNEQGIDINMNTQQVKDMLMRHQEFAKQVDNGVYRNPDGSTAFAGIKFSKNSIINPELFGQLFDLTAAEKNTQSAFKSAPMQWLGKKIETPGSTKLFATSYGTLANSVSSTARKYAGLLLDDVRGRGITTGITMTAEANRQRIIRQLAIPHMELIQARKAWLKDMKGIRGYNSASVLEFDRSVIQRYNEKYSGHKIKDEGVVDHPSIDAAADSLKKYRDMQVELGKGSARDIGMPGDNLIDKDWYAVDHEWNRWSRKEGAADLYGSFNTAAEAEDFFKKYCRAAANLKRDVIKQKIVRGIELDNIKRVENDLEPLPTKVSEKDIDDYIESSLDGVVDSHLKKEQDDMIRITDDNNFPMAEVGELNSLKDRLPMDTSLIMKKPSGANFSFDNDLREYNLDRIIMSNSSRFAGEAAFSNIFKNRPAFNKALMNMKHELQKKVASGEIDQHQSDYDFNTFLDSCMDIRGYATHADAPDRIGAVARILQKMSYAKNGALMGLNQIAEASGTIAYGGYKRAFDVIPALRDIVDRASKGKLTDSEFKDAEMEIFGDSIEREIWGANYGDQVLHRALSADNKINTMLRASADFAHNLGKVTSQINNLGAMTDSMVRGMRRGFIGDSLRWAEGETFSRFRNPFTDAKLLAARVSDSDANTIKRRLNEFYDGYKFDWRGWQDVDPRSFAQWYQMATNQAERAIISEKSIGNKQLLKESNAVTRLLFQFKDYSGRAWNAQTMRAMTARDWDDGCAAALSVASNSAVMAIRAGLAISGAMAAGDTEQVKALQERYFGTGKEEDVFPNDVVRGGIFRSNITGTPMGFGRDVYGALFGQASLRSTQDFMHHTKQKNRTPEDVVDDLVNGAPAVREITSTAKGIAALRSLVPGGTTTQSDAENMLRLCPFTNMLPIATFLKAQVKQHFPKQ